MKITFENPDELDAFIDRVSVVCPSKFGLKDKLRDKNGVCPFEGKDQCSTCWLLAIGKIACNIIVGETEADEEEVDA